MNYSDKYCNNEYSDRSNQYKHNMRGEYISYNQEERIEDKAANDYNFYNSPNYSDEFNF